MIRRPPSPPPAPYKARPKKPKPDAAAPPPLAAKVAARARVERKTYQAFHAVKGC